jgi:transposase InsO family protein
MKKIKYTEEQIVAILKEVEAGIGYRRSAIKFIDECLSMHWFMSLSHARTVIEEWRNDYILQRPHTSLKGLTPYEFACLAENRGFEYSNYGLNKNWG